MVTPWVLKDGSLCLCVPNFSQRFLDYTTWGQTIITRSGLMSPYSFWLWTSFATYNTVHEFMVRVSHTTLATVCEALQMFTWSSEDDFLGRWHLA